jgi:hypothetical protein
VTGRGLGRFAVPRGGDPPQRSTQVPSRRASDGHPDEAAQVLARFARPRKPPTPGEACEMCGEPVPDDHRHVVDLERRGLLCACRGCALLFSGPKASSRVSRDAKVLGDDAAQGRYRTVPDRYLRIDPFDLSPRTWAALQIPVGVAFMVHNTQMEQTVAFYPSPGGSTESELPLDAWSDVVAANPALAHVEPDVEAVLVRTGSDGDTCYVVPVDRCYELVGVLRTHWRGFDGGHEVREHLDRFFSDVDGRSRLARSRASAGGVQPASSPPHQSGDAT